MCEMLWIAYEYPLAMKKSLWIIKVDDLLTV